MPAYTKLSINNAYYQSRYLNDQGRLFFNSAEGLVPQDKNGKADVYQYEPLGANCSEEDVDVRGSRSGVRVADLHRAPHPRNRPSSTRAKRATTCSS